VDELVSGRAERGEDLIADPGFVGDDQNSGHASRVVPRPPRGSPRTELRGGSPS
jgi:hypothetical protein